MVWILAERIVSVLKVFGIIELWLGSKIFLLLWNTVFRKDLSRHQLTWDAGKIKTWRREGKKTEMCYAHVPTP